MRAGGRHFNQENPGSAKLPGLPAPSIPNRKLKARQDQGDIADTPLFGQERAERERGLEAAQGGLFDASAPHACPFCQGWDDAASGAILRATGEANRDITVAAAERMYPDYTGAEVELYINAVGDAVRGDRFRLDLHRKELK